MSWLDVLAEGDQVLVARQLRADVEGTVVRITRGRQFVVKCWNREVRFSRRGQEVGGGLISAAFLKEWTAEAGAAAEAAREQDQLEARFSNPKVFAGLSLETLREIDRLVKESRAAATKETP